MLEQVELKAHARQRRTNLVRHRLQQLIAIAKAPGDALGHAVHRARQVREHVPSPLREWRRSAPFADRADASLQLADPAREWPGGEPDCRDDERHER